MPDEERNFTIQTCNKRHKQETQKRIMSWVALVCWIYYVLFFFHSKKGPTMNSAALYLAKITKGTLTQSPMSTQKVTLSTKGRYVVLGNGLLQLTISNPLGLLTGVNYGGMDNILDIKSDEYNRGYWDINWNLPGEETTTRYKLVEGAEYREIQMKNDLVELSFSSTYNPANPGRGPPLSIDTRYILRSGVSGFYCYSICEIPPKCRAFNIAQIRMVFKLRQEKFHYMAISDTKQRIMPVPEDLLPNRGKVLIVPESVLLVNPINPDLKGEVDDKYQYSMDNKDGGVHGWISSGPVIGFWVIFPSHEFRNGGPTKQNLTAHTGPACLAMCHGQHYIGADILAQFEEGETWRKVFGPIFVYLNSTPNTETAHELWIDAKNQRSIEEASWPYNFISSPYYLITKERGSVSGKLFVQDRFISDSLIPAKNAYIGLSAAQTEGSWQAESKGYQFWAQTDTNGNFAIKNVIPGKYGLHGWVPGFIGDYLNNNLVTVVEGTEENLGTLTYVPIRDGPTVWEIGYPDRTSIDYYVPDVNPMYVNKLFLHSTEKYRQYGLWDRYTDIHPQSDQVFTVGVSDPKKDWFFAQVDRRGSEKYGPTTWKIEFNLETVVEGTYKLRLALASATRSDLEVHVNQIEVKNLVFQIMNLGLDNAVCRHGIHGLYRLFSVNILSSMLVKGDNSIFLTQAKAGDELCGILYDYLRLEAPTSSRKHKKVSLYHFSE